MKRLMFVEVRGKTGNYSFHFKGDPDHIEGWRADGLNVYVVEGVIPYWVVEFGLMRPWMWAQKLWRAIRLW